MRVCFICRGYPGLGKLAGSITIDTILRQAYAKNYESLFLTYHNGYKFLSSIDRSVLDILDQGLQIQESGFCTPFGLETRNCVEALNRFEPDLLFNDGEPYLIEVTREIFNFKTVVLAHPADLYNSNNTSFAVNLFRHYYAKADLVIAHGLARLPSDRTCLEGRAGQVVEMNTLVRDSIYQHTRDQAASLTNESHVVGVLGGGSQNVSSLFRAGTQQLGEWIIRACNEIGIQQITLYCADQTIHSNLTKVAQKYPVQPTLIAEPQDNTDSLIQATVVVGRAGRNLISELIVLNKKAIIVPIGAEKFRGGTQIKTAERAIEMSRNLVMTSLAEGYDKFQEALAVQMLAPTFKTQWRPGNDEILKILQPLIRTSQAD